MTRQSREMLIRQSKEMGITQKEAKILGEDPFFSGTDQEYEYAQWAAQAWDTMMAQRQARIHLRGFHYWLLSTHYQKLDGALYAQTDPYKEWVELLWCCKIARYLGVGTWEDLVDFKHPEPEDSDLYHVTSGFWGNFNGEDNVAELVQDKLTYLVDDILDAIKGRAPWYDESGYQTYHLEVWVEKESMGEFIKPVIQRMRGCYQALVGQASVEKVNLCYQRCIRAAQNGKRVRIFYISDWDRYGWQMPIAVARKLEFMAWDKDEELDIKLKHLALNEQQVNQFDLPPAPKHGEMVVELDALEAIHPGALANIVRDALQPYYDRENPREVTRENNRMAGAVSELVEQLRPQLEEALSGLSVEALDLDLRNAIDLNFEVPEPTHEVDDTEEDWLLDTNLSYWEQWESYKEHKAGREEIGV